MRSRFTLPLVSSAISMLFIAGCGNRETTESALASEDGGPADPDGEAAAAANLDEPAAAPGGPTIPADPVIIDQEAAAGQRVATVFFKGGSGAHCVKWNITASAEDGDEGSELTLIKAQRLEKKQGDTVADSDGDLVLNSTTIGGKDGFKFLVDDGVDLSFKGEVTNCDGSKSDAVSFSTKVSELKLKQVWKGAKLKDEGTGKTRMFLRISKIKEGKKEPKKKGKGKGKGKGKS